MNLIGAGIVGVGKIGRAHAAAIKEIDCARLAAIAVRDSVHAASLASALQVPRFYSDFRDLIADPAIDIVHVCTPNSSHHEICKSAILAGKAVLCEKPLAISSGESEELVELSLARNVLTAVNFLYRHFPAVGKLRDIIRRGCLGSIYAVYGNYLQDWLLDDTDYDWRIDSSLGGPSRAMADIGSHWCDLAQFLTGQRITAVCADLVTFLPVRKRKLSGAGADSGDSSCGNACESINVDTEDYGSVLLQFSKGTHGCLTVSQVSAGGKSGPNIRVDGSKGSAQWDYSEPGTILMRNRDEPERKLAVSGSAQSRADAQRRMIESFYDAFRGMNSGKDMATYAEFCHAHYIVRVIEAMLASSKSGGWQKV